jgi:hypothetical protein
MDIANKQMLIICESFADMFRKLADSYKDPEQPKPAEAPKAEEKKPEAPITPKPLTPAQEEIKKTLDELDRFNASKPKEEGKGKLPDFNPAAAPIINKASLQEAECKIDRDLAFFRFVKEMAPRTKEPYHWFARKDSMTVGNIGHNCDFKAKSDSFYLKNILAEKFLANVFGMHDANNPKRKEMIHAIVVAMGEAERLAGINKEKEGK